MVLPTLQEKNFILPVFIFYLMKMDILYIFQMIKLILIPFIFKTGKKCKGKSVHILKNILKLWNREVLKDKIIYKFEEEYKMIIGMIILQLVILTICSITLIYLLVRKKTMECFYVEEENLYLNSLPAVKIPLSDIDYVEFYYTRIRISYRGQIKVHKKNGKVVKRFFQTSKISLSVTEQMILDEIDKLTPFFKKYYIPYTIQDN
jgi:hypothetical protein